MRRFSLFLALAAMACGDDAETPAPTVAPTETTSSNNSAAAAETAEALVEQIQALASAVESKDTQAIDTEIARVVLPKARVWFEQRFGGKRGPELFTDYEPLATRGRQLADEIAGLRAAGYSEISAEKYERIDDLKAVGYQTAALKAMLLSTPLYSVRLARKSPDPGFHVWSFVYDSGSFRFVGKLTSIAKRQPFGDLDLNEFRPLDARRLRENRKPQK